MTMDYEQVAEEIVTFPLRPLRPCVLAFYSFSY